MGYDKVMGSGADFPAHQLSGSWVLWVTTEYELRRVWVIPESTVLISTANRMIAHYYLQVPRCTRNQTHHQMYFLSPSQGMLASRIMVLVSLAELAGSRFTEISPWSVPAAQIPQNALEYPVVPSVEELLRSCIRPFPITNGMFWTNDAADLPHHRYFGVWAEKHQKIELRGLWPKSMFEEWDKIPENGTVGIKARFWEHTSRAAATLVSGDVVVVSIPRVPNEKGWNWSAHDHCWEDCELATLKSRMNKVGDEYGDFTGLTRATIDKAGNTVSEERLWTKGEPVPKELGYLGDAQDICHWND
ncbi:hypothetical protein C8J56DRAFT_1031199 [Mycena floridula]|nr:hypothetical protein C8J56DRAFT_1031199 [Mycena floridula]